MAKKLVMPGVVLKGYLDDYNIKVSKLAEDIGLSQSAVRQIISTRVKVSTEVGLRLAKYFGNDSKYWIELQTDYDVAELKQKADFAAALKAIKKAKKQPAEAASAKKTTRRKADPNAPKRTRRKKEVAAADSDSFGASFSQGSDVSSQ